MKKIVNSIIMIVAMSMSVSYASHAWVIDRDFNSGVAGTQADGTPDGFDHDSDALYDRTHSVDGQAAKTDIGAGGTGWGHWGGVIDFPTPLVKGDKLYFEMYIYIPTGFKIESGNGSLKFLRFYAKETNGANGGALDIQIADDSSPRSTEIRILKEGQFLFFHGGQKGMLTKDTWHKVNVSYDVSDVNANLKMWIDNAPLNLTPQNPGTNLVSIVKPTDKIMNFYLFTYYNSGSPITQHLWIDNIKITNVRPSWMDVLPAGSSPPSAPVAN